MPGEENPLAEGLPDGEGEGLLEEGKDAEEMADRREKASGPAEETE